MFHVNGDTFATNMLTRGDPNNVEVVSYLSKSAIRKKATESYAGIYFDTDTYSRTIQGAIGKTTDTPPLCAFLRMHFAFPTLSLSAGDQELVGWILYCDVVAQQSLTSARLYVKNDAGTYKLWLREPLSANFDIEIGTVVTGTEYVLELHTWMDKTRVYFGTPSTVAYVDEATYSHVGDYQAMSFGMFHTYYRSDVEIALFSVYTDRIEINYTTDIDACKHNGSNADGNAWVVSEDYLDAGVSGGDVVKGTLQDIDIDAAGLAADTNWLFTGVASDNRAGEGRKVHVDGSDIKDGWI